MGKNILVYFRLVHLKMNNFSIRGKGIDFSRNAVVKTHTDTNEQITLLYSHVGSIGAVHPHHTKEALLLCGNTAQPHKGAYHRNSGIFNNFPHNLGLIGKGYTTADEKNGTLCFAKGLNNITNLSLIPGEIPLVATELHLLWIFIVQHGSKYILGDINNHRSRTACSGNKKCFLNHPWQLRGLLYQIIVLGNRGSDTYDIRLLKGVLTNKRISHLAREAHQRHRIHIGGGNTSNKIGSSRTRGGKNYTHPSSGPCVAIRSMNGPLLVAGQNMRKSCLINRII